MIEHDETGVENFRICEINARFCWNGAMVLKYGQNALSTFNIESRGLISVTDHDAVSLTLNYIESSASSPLLVRLINKFAK